MIRRWFTKRGKASCEPVSDRDKLALDLLNRDWQCACCGGQIHGVTELAARHPDPWPHGEDYEPNAALRLDGDFLSEDFCVIEGKYFMVRSILEIPVQGLERPWGYGCWTTLSRNNFGNYVDGFDNGEFTDDGPWFGWLCNHLKGLFDDAEPLKLDVHPQRGRQRPLLVVQDYRHPLGIAQREGITPSTLFDLLMANGHGPTLQ